MKKIYTSIDIGTDSVKVLVSEIFNNVQHVLAVSSVKTNGVKKGLIVDADQVLTSIKLALKEAGDLLGVSIERVIAIVPSNQVKFCLVGGETTITNEEKKVAGDDIVRALQASVYNKLEEDRELVTILPLEFIVDDNRGIRNPLGLSCQKLGVKAVMVTTPKKNVQSVISILESISIEVSDVIIGPICDYAVLQNETTNTGVGALINIGAEKTEISIFNKGIIVNTNNLGVGGSHIDHDISYMFKINKAEAKKIKETFGVAHRRYASPNEIYETMSNDNQPIKINQYELSEIITSRLTEILNFIKKETFLLTNKEISYIMVTGGVSTMSGFSTVAEEVFGRKVLIADIKTMGIRDNKFNSVAGATRYFYNKLQMRGKEYSMFNIDKQKELVLPNKKIKNENNGEESIINKFFGYFFDN